MRGTCSDKSRVKGLFIHTRKEDMKKISWNGLLNHQLMIEEGGLGILTPDELTKQSKKRVKVTTRQNTIRSKLYEARTDSAQLENLTEMLASIKTRVVEHKKTSTIVYDGCKPMCVRRHAPYVTRSLPETITKTDPFEDPKSWRITRKSAL